MSHIAQKHCTSRRDTASASEAGVEKLTVRREEETVGTKSAAGMRGAHATSRRGPPSVASESVRSITTPSSCSVEWSMEGGGASPIPAATAATAAAAAAAAHRRAAAARADGWLTCMPECCRGGGAQCSGSLVACRRGAGWRRRGERRGRARRDAWRAERLERSCACELGHRDQLSRTLLIADSVGSMWCAAAAVHRYFGCCSFRLCCAPAPRALLEVRVRPPRGFDRVQAEHASRLSTRFQALSRCRDASGRRTGGSDQSLAEHRRAALSGAITGPSRSTGVRLRCATLPSTAVRCWLRVLS